MATCPIYFPIFIHLIEFCQRFQQNNANRSSSKRIIKMIGGFRKRSLHSDYKVLKQTELYVEKVLCVDLVLSLDIFSNNV